MRKKIIFSTLTILLLSILLSTAVTSAQPGVPTIYDAIDDIEERIDHRGIANSLTSKLENALEALEDGDFETFTNILNAFINNVEAQSGKKIDEDYADTLIGWAQTWIGDPASALDIFLHEPEYTTVIVYQHNPSFVHYELHTMVRVYKSDGVENIESVTMITPTGEEVGVFSVHSDGDPNYLNYHFLMEYLPEPIFGIYTFRVVDMDGDVAESSCLIESWIDVPVTSFTPGQGENYPAGSTIEFVIDWGPNPPVIDGYYIQFFRNVPNYTWFRDFSGDEPIVYDGPPLTGGEEAYGFHIFCHLPEIEGEVKVMGFFFYDFPST